MPCRTRGSGLDVEGLGIVFLEASASGLPVIAGRSGGAPETVQAGRTGVVVDGRDVGGGRVRGHRPAAVTGPGRLAGARTAGPGSAPQWNWDRSATRLAELLSG